MDIGLESQYAFNMESEVNSKGMNDQSVVWMAGPAVMFKIPQYKMSAGLSFQFALYQDYDAKRIVSDIDYPAAGSLGEEWRIETLVGIVF